MPFLAVSLFIFYTFTLSSLYLVYQHGLFSRSRRMVHLTDPWAHLLSAFHQGLSPIPCLEVPQHSPFEENAAHPSVFQFGSCWRNLPLCLSHYASHRCLFLDTRLPTWNVETNHEKSRLTGMELIKELLNLKHVYV